MNYSLFQTPPIPYESLSTNTRNVYTIKICLVIVVVLLLIGVIVPIGVIFSSSKSKIISRPMNDHRQVSKNCGQLPLSNSTWSQQSVIIVNQLGICTSKTNQLCRPHDIFLDNWNNYLYIVDQSNNRIQKYSLPDTPFDNSELVNGMTVANEGLLAPSSIFVDIQTEDMYILNYDKAVSSGQNDPISYRVHLWKNNSQAGQIIIQQQGEGYFQPYSHIVLDEQMNIYVETRYHIRKWLASSNYKLGITVAGMRASGEFNFDLDFISDVHGLYIDKNLIMYIIDSDHSRILKWSQNAQQGTTIVSGVRAYGITLDCHGNIYYSSYTEHKIYRLNVSTNETTVIIDGEIIDPDERHRVIIGYRAAKFDKFGNLYVVDTSSSQIKKFSIL